MNTSQVRSVALRFGVSRCIHRGPTGSSARYTPRCGNVFLEKRGGAGSSLSPLSLFFVPPCPPCLPTPSTSTMTYLLVDVSAYNPNPKPTLRPSSTPIRTRIPAYPSSSTRRPITARRARAGSASACPDVAHGPLRVGDADADRPVLRAVRDLEGHAGSLVHVPGKGGGGLLVEPVWYDSVWAASRHECDTSAGLARPLPFSAALLRGALRSMFLFLSVFLRRSMCVGCVWSQEMKDPILVVGARMSGT